MTPPGDGPDGCPAPRSESGMDGLRKMLEAVQDAGLVAGHLRGLFHVCIGRKITATGDAVVSNGVTWRELANLLKIARFDTELVREVGADPEELSPRDRQRFWYGAIALARPDSAEAIADGQLFATLIEPLGYRVGPPPAGLLPAPANEPKQPHPKKPDPDAGKKKKK